MFELYIVGSMIGLGLSSVIFDDDDPPEKVKYIVLATAMSWISVGIVIGSYLSEQDKKKSKPSE